MLLRRSPLLLATALLTGCGGEGTNAARSDSDALERGGTLLLVGNSDVDKLSTTSGYYTATNVVFRGFVRQLVAYPTDPDFTKEMHVVADLATAVPTRENGGISADGKTYTFHLRRGVRWNTQPPRELVAADAERGIEMMCNPVSPVGAPAYYRTTILGMDEFCDAFAKAGGSAAEIKKFVDARQIDGVRVPDDTTIVFTLSQPATDFVDLLALNFAAPWPVEYLAYVPDDAEFRTHTISIGPYQIKKYVPNREIHLGRNPAWDPATDPVRRAFVDSIVITLGVTAQNAQQQLQAGAADMSFDQPVPTADVAALIAAKDPNLVIGPPGEFAAGEVYMPFNMVSPNERGAMAKVKVRQAFQYALDRMAHVQVLGGPEVAQPLDQAVHGGAAGNTPGYHPYPEAGDRGNPEKAKQLLAEAGYPNGLTVKLLYRVGGLSPQHAQTVQASFERAGIRTELISATAADFYSKYLQNPENAKRGVWDIALPAWGPDWYSSNNGRTMVQPLFDGRSIGLNSVNYGAYNNPVVNTLIDKALSALTEQEATAAWVEAARRVIEDAGIVPVVQYKQAMYHSSRVKNCIFHFLVLNCDPTHVALEGAAVGRAP